MKNLCYTNLADMGIFREMSRNRVVYPLMLGVMLSAAAYAQEVPPVSLPAAPPTLPEVTPLSQPATPADTGKMDKVLEEALKAAQGAVPAPADPAVVAPANPARVPLSPAEQQEVDKELAYRASMGRADDIKLLITKGANPNQLNEDGVPILSLASARKDPEALAAVMALTEGGAEINTKDKTGQTALYYAARSSNATVVDHLLKRGIDYYSLDNNGDIARTIAFRNGRQDIVDAMDAFVRGQSQTLTENYTNIQKTAEEIRLEAEKRNAEAEKKAAADEEARIRKEKNEQAKKLREYEANLKKLDQKVYDISYHACAFQYWSFNLAADQTTDLTEDETYEVIELHRETVQNESLEVMKMFDVGQEYVNRIIDPSKQYIFDQLNAMPSRTYRKQHGVGQLDDVATRCTRVARSWSITKSGETPGVERNIIESGAKAPAAATTPAKKAAAKKTATKPQAKKSAAASKQMKDTLAEVNKRAEETRKKAEAAKKKAAAKAKEVGKPLPDSNDSTGTFPKGTVVFDEKGQPKEVD